jgi:hypothetical protein
MGSIGSNGVFLFPFVMMKSSNIGHKWQRVAIITTSFQSYLSILKGSLTFKKASIFRRDMLTNSEQESSSLLDDFSINQACRRRKVIGRGGISISP